MIPILLLSLFGYQTRPNVKAYIDQDDIPAGVVDVSDDQDKATVHYRDWAGNLLPKKSLIVGGENAAIRGTFDNFVAGDIILKNSFNLSPEALVQKLSVLSISTL